MTEIGLMSKAGYNTFTDCSSTIENAAIMSRILKHVDLVLYDFKHMNQSDHQDYTGVGNDLILDNARKIRMDLKLPMLARLPIITGHNDSPENLKATAAFISRELGHDVQVHLLPYHRLGESKYDRMEKSAVCVRFDPPGDDRMEAHKKIFESFNISRRSLCNLTLISSSLALKRSSLTA